MVTGVGGGVTRFKAGDTVGVGYFVGSCRSCDSCGKGNENYCAGVVQTSNGVDHAHGGVPTRGVFSDVIVVNEHYVVRGGVLRRHRRERALRGPRPGRPGADRTAPLLCAGVTVYSPMMRHGLNEAGKHLGVVGLGGLGHVAVKFGKAFGMKVTVISAFGMKVTVISKRQEAIEHLGADEFLISRDPEQMKAATGTMDGIIDTVSAWHPITPLLALLKPLGQMVIVGGPSKPLELPAYAFLPGGKGVAGSLVGSVGDCQAMLEFAGKHGIGAEVVVIKMDYVNTAIERLEKNDVRYRFVIDVAGSLGSAA
ncbi:unnamed protein product [Miscanthus lutarioriparius]|uniref:cinnamyl-alcohol dehydrogenase n=1 Tax=Miscanthus lutarioriparius TaxID=422564 RepID=A0A811NK06_9POAL|nr:unnamed protein product [Miscanthus lutarioriparius]